jgi:hypothetical protein
MSKNEVDLNDPLNWFIADSMNDYDVRLDPETAKELAHRHNVYPKLVSALSEAIEALKQAGQTDKAESLSNRLKALADPEI